MKCLNCGKIMELTDIMDDLERYHCPSCDFDILVKKDRMLPVSEGLLEDIRHTLVSLSGLKAFDALGESVKSNDSHVTVSIAELIPLDFNEAIKQIDEVLK